MKSKDDKKEELKELIALTIKEREIVKLKVKRLSKHAKLPTYATEGSACMDIYAVEDVMLDPRVVKFVRTGLAVAVPDGWEMQMRPRSGMAVKYQIVILNSPCTVDSDYRGELMLGMKNLSSKHYYVNIGDRIAQMVLKRVPLIELEEVEELDDTERSDGGFGHTGR